MFRTLICLALLAAPALAQCEDCPMHAAGKSDPKAAPASQRIALAVAGADSEEARAGIARGIEFVLGLAADSLAFDAEGRLPIPVAAGKRVPLEELRTALERIPEGAAAYAIDEARTTLSGSVHLEVKGLRCDGCAKKIAARLEPAGSDVAVNRTEDAAAVTFTADGLSLADLKARFEGSHFELLSVAVGTVAECPPEGCEKAATGGCCKKGS